MRDGELNNLRIIRQDSPIKLPRGEFLGDGHWFSEYDDGVTDFFDLRLNLHKRSGYHALIDSIRVNEWDVGGIIRSNWYDCPFSLISLPKRYVHAYPVGITEIYPYEMRNQCDGCSPIPFRSPHNDDVALRSYLGHGYDENRSESDGYVKIGYAWADLSDGRKILFAINEWFNK